jgi:hypothetical protein
VFFPRARKSKGGSISIPVTGWELSTPPKFELLFEAAFDLTSPRDAKPYLLGLKVLLKFSIILPLLLPHYESSNLLIFSAIKFLPEN